MRRLLIFDDAQNPVLKKASELNEVDAE